MAATPHPSTLWEAQELELEAYMDRIGHHGPREPTLETLRTLQAAHLDAIPFEKDAGIFEVHQILLTQNGTYILENINTAELAKDKAYEFLFVLGQNKYQGSVQGMINPVAIR